MVVVVVDDVDDVVATISVYNNVLFANNASMITKSGYNVLHLPTFGRNFSHRSRVKGRRHTIKQNPAHARMSATLPVWMDSPIAALSWHSNTYINNKTRPLMPHLLFGRDSPTAALSRYNEEPRRDAEAERTKLRWLALVG